MDFQPGQAQHHVTAADLPGRPADLTWLDMSGDLWISKAREIAQSTSTGTQVFERMISKLCTWRFAQDSWRSSLD